MSNISLKKNYIYSLSYQILNLITPLITAPYVARVLGADGVGIYSLYSINYDVFHNVWSIGNDELWHKGDGEIA